MTGRCKVLWTLVFVLLGLTMWSRFRLQWELEAVRAEIIASRLEVKNIIESASSRGRADRTKLREELVATKVAIDSRLASMESRSKK